MSGAPATPNASPCESLIGTEDRVAAATGPNGTLSQTLLRSESGTYVEWMGWTL
jgi:hypothetical protein